LIYGQDLTYAVSDSVDNLAPDVYHCKPLAAFGRNQVLTLDLFFQSSGQPTVVVETCDEFALGQKQAGVSCCRRPEISIVMQANYIIALQRRSPVG
jgi:hypothetical protein